MAAKMEKRWATCRGDALGCPVERELPVDSPEDQLAHLPDLLMQECRHQASLDRTILVLVTS